MSLSAVFLILKARDILSVLVTFCVCVCVCASCHASFCECDVNLGGLPECHSSVLNTLTSPSGLAGQIHRHTCTNTYTRTHAHTHMHKHVHTNPCAHTHAHTNNCPAVLIHVINRPLGAGTQCTSL